MYHNLANEITKEAKEQSCSTIILEDLRNIR